MRRLLLSISAAICISQAFAQDSLVLQKISDNIMLHGQCYDNLRVLCKDVGHRLSGSPEAEKAVAWGEKAMEAAGADKVWLQPVDVPYWVRGKESLKLKFSNSDTYIEVPMLSLGNAVGTNGKVLEAEVIIANSFEEFERIPAKDVKGKIVFFNYRFRQDFIHTFNGYGDAGPYRWKGPSIASAKGASGIIIRSVSTGVDDFPHTGAMHYADSVKPIPAVAIGNTSADMLEQQFKKGPVTAQITAECRMIGTAKSYNVIGEITGTVYPNKVIVVGGHLDSWDVGDGAHDDGAGCVQSIEVIRTLKALNIQPRYTVRAVLFMNEENGLKGGLAYNDSSMAHKEEHILAIESDAGGFSPRGFGLAMDESKRRQIQAYRKLFLPYGVYDFDHSEGGADISYLQKRGIPCAGLLPDPQRYFDLHHTNNDVFEQVNHR
ncbi:MAG: M20/M25/M40 family metallo-hydrolase, partial [Chitinophagaceae bacterium]|nr:M20/M25/M40 family metallo-hydrolase [Chitinophagaceae bacterium]